VSNDWREALEVDTGDTALKRGRQTPDRLLSPEQAQRKEQRHEKRHDTEAARSETDKRLIMLPQNISAQPLEYFHLDQLNMKENTFV